MKRIHLTILSIFLLTAYSYCQSGKNVVTTVIKGREGAIDTVITKKTELSQTKIFLKNYKRDEMIIQALKPFMISEIVNFDNPSHPIYLRHIQEAREKLQDAKSALLQRIRTNSSYRDYMAKYNISNDADLNAVNFVPTPLYYITPNVSLLKSGENIAKYYNLCTGGIKYLMFRNNRLNGFLDYYDSKSIFRGIPNFIAESYYQIKKLGKNPIALSQSISTANPKDIIGSLSMFGYIDQGRLILSFCDEGVIHNRGNELQKSRFQKVYTLETAESFFSGNGQRSVINKWLEDKVNSLKKRRN